MKVTDLGIARILGCAVEGDGGKHGMTGGIGSWRYMAPEVVRHKKYDEKAWGILRRFCKKKGFNSSGGVGLSLIQLAIEYL